MSNINTEIQSAPNNDVYKEWLDEWEAWYLSIPRNCDGRPVWEPPIFDYSEWIGEEYEKKREAMLKYTGGDVARTTELMDVDTESDVLWTYTNWATENADNAVDSESRQFFLDLWKEVDLDFDVLVNEWWSIDGGIIYETNEDGTYRVRRSNLFRSSPDDSSFEDSDSISENASNRSISPSPAGDSDSKPTPISLPHLSVTEQNRISSPTDEAEELAWLNSIDASASTPTNTNLAQPNDRTPLALRLIYLHNITLSKVAYEANKMSEDDDLD